MRPIENLPLYVLYINFMVLIIYIRIRIDYGKVQIILKIKWLKIFF